MWVKIRTGGVLLRIVQDSVRLPYQLEVKKDNLKDNSSGLPQWRFLIAGSESSGASQETFKCLLDFLHGEEERSDERPTRIGHGSIFNLLVLTKFFFFELILGSHESDQKNLFESIRPS